VQTAKQENKIFGKVSAEFDPDLVRPVGVGLPSAGEEKNPVPPPAQDAKTMESKEGEQPAAQQSEQSPKEDSVLKRPEEVQKEVQRLNQRVQGWAYELPTFRVENFSKFKKDLLAKLP
jgi:hypothetical protein